MTKPLRYFLFRCLALSLTIFCMEILTFGSPASAQTVTRLTLNPGIDISPTWDPRGGTIAYLRPKQGSTLIYDAYRVLSSGQGGEQPILTGLSQDFGVAVGLSWIGQTGSLAVEEAISGFEVLKFDTSQAPYDRTVANGSDAANTLLLSINGGGGGGLLKVSRDGNVAMIRFSTSGSAGGISIRTGLVSSMLGQVSSTFGTALYQVTAGDGRFYNGGSLSPDGSQSVISFPLTVASSAHDLVVKGTAAGAGSFNITNSASSGVFNINPDFSPDGTKIAFSRWTGVSTDTYDLYVINADGTGLTQITNTPGFSETAPSWSPDGTTLAYVGTHLAGREAEFPALAAGETANPNIYMISLAPINIVTPKTQLVEPPVVQIANRQVTFGFTPFAKAQKDPVVQQLIQRANSEIKQMKSKGVTNARAPQVKFSFRYQLVVSKVGGAKRDTRSKFATRNTITFRKVSPGSYSAKYRVEIRKKVGSKITVAGRTKFSPSATYTVQ